MSMPAKKEKGKRYGKWLVLFRAGSNKRRLAMWRCICDCGEVRDIAGSTLRSGSSSGCWVCAAKQRWEKRRENLTTPE